MNMFILSWRYLLARPLNTALNILLLALGLAILTVLILVQDQFEKKMTNDAQGIDLVIGAKGSPLQLVLSSVYHIDFPTGNIDLGEAIKISKNRLIKSVIPLGLGDNYEGFRIVGTTHDYLNLHQAGFEKGQVWNHPFEVVLGAEVAQKLKLKVGDSIIGSHGIGSSSHAHDDHAYKVTGVLDTKGTVIDQLILTSIESVWFTHEDSNHMGEPGDNAVTTTGLPEFSEGKEITALLVQYRNPMAAVQLPRFINSRSSLQAASPAFEINRLFELLGVGISIMQGIAFIIIVISGLGIFIALFNSLKERKYDLAVMRTMGASKAQVFVHILLEGLLLTFLGALAGIAIGHLFLILLVISNEQNTISGISGFIFLEEELWVMAYALLIGIVASILPAWRAYQTNIALQLTKN